MSCHNTLYIILFEKKKILTMNFFFLYFNFSNTIEMIMFSCGYGSVWLGRLGRVLTYEFGLGLMFPVHWTRSDCDTCLKMDTCHHLIRFNATIGY